MRLSIALCTFNGQEYLPAQLASIAEQSRLPDELIAYDDCSTDGTLELLQRFALGCADSASRLIVNETTLGSTANFELAIAACTGDVIFLCDQDDVWNRDKLARFAAIFEAEPQTGLIASDLEVIDSQGKAVGRRMWRTLGFSRPQQAAVEAGFGPQLWLRANTLTGAAMAFRAELRDILLPIPAGWVHDAWIAFIAGAVAPIRLIREPMTRYRSHLGQQIGATPRGVRKLVQDARRRGAAYFAGVAANFEAAANRLESFSHELFDPQLIRLTRQKAAFARVQQRMREGSRLGRIVPALRQLTAGRYHGFTRGLRAFAADLFL
ncbi:MAG TPA: glycosyltransferase family 2 protein [Gemmataceae bacterium]